MCIKLKGNQDVRTLYIGERRLDIIEGLAIKKYMPESLMDLVEMAMVDRHLKWTDEYIQDCIMVITYNEYVSVMYKHVPIQFDGTLMFNFTVSKHHNHRFSFPLKWKHLEFYFEKNLF
ncbi:hypothetical protein [Maribacter thermophilus]|uniref:hypothetical protein n=1 Tax=Maribacter thermophilus TaxID=1197874 RepID=UPI0012F8E3E2|nr:hypothetical protein [Maribacter thermophilus]